MPFLPGRFLTDPEKLQWYRPLYQMPLSSGPSSEPVGDDVQPVSASEAPRAAEKTAEVAGDAVWRAHIDIAVERRRWWWWRLAASIVGRRLGR